MARQRGLVGSHDKETVASELFNSFTDWETILEPEGSITLKDLLSPSNWDLKQKIKITRSQKCYTQYEHHQMKLFQYDWYPIPT